MARCLHDDGGPMEYILSLSYGKDSLACLGAIEALGWPLDRVVHAEVWATDNILADFPPMVEFKARANVIIKERWGIKVEYVRSKNTAKDIIYHKRTKGKRIGDIMGWPLVKTSNAGCELQKYVKTKPVEAVQKGNVSYLGIAADEPKRFHILGKAKISPLVEAGWAEDFCREWCERNGLLSPIYTSMSRGGCWFCPNQRVEQLRFLRKNYPYYWALMLKWDRDSPVAFKPSGHTVHDFERRFYAEDIGLISSDDKRFRWKILDEKLVSRIKDGDDEEA